MTKKLIVVLIIGAIIGISTIPMWTAKMADDAFANPNLPNSPQKIEDALKVRMYVYMYPEARKIAEKAVLYFPEAKELPYFIYTAALSSEKAGNPLAAIYWYGYFIELFPKHELASQAQNNYNKLKALHTIN
ncbi:MAG TPA: hypothetical protein DET40_09775 [Lentisphaeria bacterium]|nr:MAG: hypothetical protein A2X45_08560 [Lentisphaerae bacterium GWF2_50_93]HCE43823.1 hypothetical protein [Lentisphaeria bacterium]